MDSDLLDVIHVLGPDDLKKLFYALGMTQRDVELADRRNGPAGRDDMMAVEVLQKWHQANTYTATRESLLLALRSCGNIEVVEELSCNWSKRPEGTF